MSSPGQMNGVSPPLAAIQSSQVVTKRMVEADREEQASNNWKFAAMVVDRLCLYIFTMFLLASTVGIFSSAPYLVA
ncbi:unnamed protein product [Strongylus vulgaris]|uniref:Neurotransmitter-gated ion-channel transmembrane domain-containing protein n=1 Tax=Strongylus vulgaris TaxID=40348 RepID=A0A3P7KD87_STRVU|nr:unnamed protein product [Strongylus vulgaris]